MMADLFIRAWRPCTGEGQLILFCKDRPLPGGGFLFPVRCPVCGTPAAGDEGEPMERHYIRKARLVGGGPTFSGASERPPDGVATGTQGRTGLIGADAPLNVAGCEGGGAVDG